MDIFEFTGFAAAICTTVSFLPQAIKTLRTRKTEDISIFMYILLTVGVSLWLVYGFFIDSIPIIAANAISLLFVFPTLIMKIRFK